MGATLDEDRIIGYATKGAEAIKDHSVACVKLADATRILADLERERSERKVAAVYRLLDCDFTPGKNFTPTQAADYALLDEQYREYKTEVAKWTQVRFEHDLHRESAKLTAELYCALVRAEIVGAQ